MLNQFSILKPVVSDAVSTIQLFIEGIVAQLKADKLKDQKARREADSQTEYVDGRKLPAEYKNYKAGNIWGFLSAFLSA